MLCPANVLGNPFIRPAPTCLPWVTYKSGQRRVLPADAACPACTGRGMLRPVQRPRARSMVTTGAGCEVTSVFVARALPTRSVAFREFARQLPRFVFRLGYVRPRFLCASKNASRADFSSAASSSLNMPSPRCMSATRLASRYRRHFSNIALNSAENSPTRPSATIFPQFVTTSSASSSARSESSASVICSRSP